MTQASPRAWANYQDQVRSHSEVAPEEFSATLQAWLTGHKHTSNLVAWPFVPLPLAVVPLHMCRLCEVSAFIIPPGSGIPMHDHRGMHVLSRLLSGSLHVHSATPQWPPAAAATAPTIPAVPHERQEKHTGDTWLLGPSEGNLHAFECPLPPQRTCAGADVATVLEVLLPPYAADAPCTYYAVSQDGQQVHAEALHALAAQGGASARLSLSPLPGHPLGLNMLGL